MKPLAYVSDEMYVALPDVQAEFESIDTGAISVLRSSPRGAFYGELPDGDYRVTLAKSGYGCKDCAGKHRQSNSPYQFRLLSDALLATCGRNGFVPATRQNFVFMQPSNISSRCGATDGKRSSCG